MKKYLKNQYVLRKLKKVRKRMQQAHKKRAEEIKGSKSPVHRRASEIMRTWEKEGRKRIREGQSTGGARIKGQPGYRGKRAASGSVDAHTGSCKLRRMKGIRLRLLAALYEDAHAVAPTHCAISGRASSYSKELDFATLFSSTDVLLVIG